MLDLSSSGVLGMLGHWFLLAVMDNLPWPCCPQQNRRGCCGYPAYYIMTIGYPSYSGMSVQIVLELLSRFGWNRCPVWAGIRNVVTRFEVEGRLRIEILGVSGHRPYRNARFAHRHYLLLRSQRGASKGLSIYTLLKQQLRFRSTRFGHLLPG